MSACFTGSMEKDTALFGYAGSIWAVELVLWEERGKNYRSISFAITPALDNLSSIR